MYAFDPAQLERLLALMQTIDHNGLRDLLRPLRALNRRP